MANNAFKRKIKKLTSLNLKEISGVDHPASLHEGWAVIKSNDSELESALAEVIDPNPESLEINVEDVIKEEAEVQVQEEEIVTEDLGIDVAKELQDVRKELEEAKAQVSNLEESTATEKAVRDAQKWAIIPELDPAEFAPVLRSLRAADADVSQTVESILDAVAVALGEAGILKEIGSDGSPENEDSYGQIETMAKALVESGDASSLADGISKVATDNPELYSAYVAEMGA
tara:strand:- start:4448 stop:5140 length:693 start_codon:yes stop_codon:yes gene_type:complete